jgi:hypothetical protein
MMQSYESTCSGQICIADKYMLRMHSQVLQAGERRRVSEARAAYGPAAAAAALQRDPRREGSNHGS